MQERHSFACFFSIDVRRQRIHTQVMGYLLKCTEAYPVHKQESSTKERLLVQQYMSRVCMMLPIYFDEERILPLLYSKNYANIPGYKHSKQHFYIHTIDSLKDRFYHTILKQPFTYGIQKPTENWNQTLHIRCLHTVVLFMRLSTILLHSCFSELNYDLISCLIALHMYLHLQRTTYRINRHNFRQLKILHVSSITCKFAPSC